MIYYIIKFIIKNFSHRIEKYKNFDTDLLSEGEIQSGINKWDKISEGLQKEIGDLLKSEFTGFEAWIFSSNFEALKFIGLRPSRKIPLKNGALDCKLQKYELYSGSKKTKKQVAI